MVGGISVWQMLIILIIVLLIFGTKKIRNLGGDLGGAIKGFKKAVKEEGSEELESDKQGGDASTENVSTEGAKKPEEAKKDDSQTTKES